HVAVLVAAEAGGVTGRFFRATQANDWQKAPVAFYELLQPESIKPDGKKRSFITGRNYKAYGPTRTGPKPPKPTPPPPEPTAEEPEEEAAEAAEADEKQGFRIMRGSADDIPVVRTSADDEPAPAPQPEPPPPPAPPPPRVEKRKPPEPEPPPAPPPPPP